jgi:hypothetical protein
MKLPQRFLPKYKDFIRTEESATGQPVSEDFAQIDISKK